MHIHVFVKIIKVVDKSLDNGIYHIIYLYILCTVPYQNEISIHFIKLSFIVKKVKKYK